MSEYSTRGDVLPVSCPPRGLSRVEAAAYVGCSPSMLDEMVADGRMPLPKHVNSRRIFDRLELDICFAALPNGEDAAKRNTWDDAA